MSEIRRAVVKSYDAVAHKAAVQIAGSLAVWLDDVRVATNIPPADVSAGRQCTVLFMDPSNQDDAVIIAIQGAAPSGGGASDHKVIVTSDDTNADYLLAKLAAGTGIALSELNGGGDEDAEIAHTAVASGDLHTEYARLAGRAGSQTLQGGADASENLHLESTAHATKGYIRALNNFRMMDALAFTQNVVAIGKKSGDSVGWVGLLMDVGSLTSSPTPSRITGISGKIGSSNNDGSNASTLFGLDFQANAGRTTGSPTVSRLIGCLAQFSALGTGITITDAAAFKANRATSLFSAFTRTMGVWIPNIGKSLDTTVYGLRIDDQTLGTNRYIAWLGGSNPNLRVDAGTPPDAASATEGDTNIFAAIMENGTVTMRQFRWRQQSSLGATDKVLIAQ